MRKNYIIIFLSILMLIATCIAVTACNKNDNPGDTKKEYTISFYVDDECVKTIKPQETKRSTSPKIRRKTVMLLSVGESLSPTEIPKLILHRLITRLFL